MPLGQTTGVRSLQQLRQAQAFVNAKAQNVFISEVAGTVNGDILFSTVSAIDQTAAKAQNATWRQEHTDSYCLARDFRYGHRSRKWLFARGLHSRFDHAYQQWAVFVTTNLTTNPSIKQMTGQDVNKLAEQPYDKTLKA